MRTHNYVSPKAQQHEEAREERDRQVRDYLRNSTPLTKVNSGSLRWCPVHGRYLEVR
jgi:hypothetical protein